MIALGDQVGMDDQVGMSEMLVHVLIQTAITFEIVKSYRGFCIFLPIKYYTLRLCRLEVSARSQVFKISF